MTVKSTKKKTWNLKKNNHLASFTGKCSKMKTSCWFAAYFARLVHLKKKRES